MAEATALLPFISLSCFSLPHHYNGVHSFEEKKTLNVRELQRKQQLGTLGCLLPESRKEKDAIILEMKDRRHCSKKKVEHSNKRLLKQLVLDDVRVRSMQNRIRNMVSTHIVDVSESQIPLTSGIKFQTLNYIVSIGLSSQNMTVIVDAGSDLTWIQCDPCKSCYNQQGSLFMPSTSPSYQSILCNSSTCQSLQFTTGNSGACGSNASTCNYQVNYGDGSYTTGPLCCILGTKSHIGSVLELGRVLSL